MKEGEVQEARDDEFVSLNFEEFFREHHEKLFGTLSLVIGNRTEAEDVTQEAFVRVWNRWEKISAHPDPAGYLYRTAFNVERDRARRIRRALKRGLQPERAEDVFAALDEATDVRTALTGLSTRQRAAIVLTELFSMTSHEAAVVMGVRASTVRVLASQGRAALREALGETT
jgi:RNA polymerase sigma-70 factor (ECF subfamily)